MALSDRLTGLKGHQIELPPPPSVEAIPFDQAKVGRLMADATSIIESYYPAGAMDWLIANRPDVYQHLQEREKLVDEAYQAENLDEVVKLLQKYVDAHQRAFKVFEARPPVVERQTELGV